MSQFHFSPWIAGLAMVLCVGTAGAEGSSTEASTPETPTTAEASAAVPAGLTTAWDADQGKFVAPTDYAAQRIAEQLQLMYTVQSESLDKAGLMAPETMPNGMVRQRLGFEHMSSSIIVNPFGHGSQGQAAATCVQHGSHLKPVSVDVVTDDARPRSTPAVEGWVEQ